MDYTENLSLTEHHEAKRRERKAKAVRLERLSVFFCKYEAVELSGIPLEEVNELSREFDLKFPMHSYDKGRTRLNDAAIQFILNSYGEVSAGQLAANFKVGVSSIYRVFDLSNPRLRRNIDKFDFKHYDEERARRREAIKARTGSNKYLKEL